MSPEEWTYLVVLLISIPIGFLFKKAGESGSLPVENRGGEQGWVPPPIRFQVYAVSSPCRTWAEEMGSSSCGPGAHLVHLWPPHFAFSGHHPWDLGPHSGPALVRMRVGGDWKGRGSNLFALWFFLSFCLGLWMSLVYLLFLCVICLFVVVSLFCLFLGLVPVCLSGSSTSVLLHLCRGFWRDRTFLVCWPCHHSYSNSLSLSPSLSPSSSVKKWMEGSSP